MCIRSTDEIEEKAEADRNVVLRGHATMNMPDWVVEPLLIRLLLIGFEMSKILVHRLRDHVEIEPLRRLRLLIHIKAEAFRCSIGEPLLDRDAIALRLRDLLAAIVEKQLEIEALRRRVAQRAANLG